MLRVIKRNKLLLLFCVGISIPASTSFAEVLPEEAQLNAPTLEDIRELRDNIGIPSTITSVNCSEGATEPGAGELGLVDLAPRDNLNCKKGESAWFYHKCKDNCDGDKECKRSTWTTADGWITLWTKCSCPS